ncbi:hypothetical protein Taro_054688, partial [Colocasia esculenta]|nr:hypothetical protein [Colocasia esculenta]
MLALVLFNLGPENAYLYEDLKPIDVLDTTEDAGDEAPDSHPFSCSSEVVSTLDQVVSTPCSKHKTKSGKTGQVVSTLVQVVSTQCIKYKAKRSSSVDTSSSSVDTRDTFQKTFWPIWDS